MQKSKPTFYKQFFAVFITAIYVLVVLFSSQLHHHKSDGLNLDFSKKTEFSSSKTKSFLQDSSDCLACHFTANHHVVLNNDFSFKALVFTQETTRLFVVQEKIWDTTKASYYLRGPPILS